MNQPETVSADERIYLGRLFREGAYTDERRWVRAEDYEFLKAQVEKLRRSLETSRQETMRVSDNAIALTTVAERMLAHGERCNWFADRGDEDRVEEVRDAINKLLGRS